jgi:tRNA (cytidine/uridine-2'-O-)-methyltransferase
VSTQPDQRAGDPRAIPDAPLHLVLVEPKIPPNTGNVARLCAATGCTLHLVEPLGFSIGDRELKRAGLDYWDAVALYVHRSFEAFLAATFGRRRWYVEVTGATPYREARFAHGDFVIFGPETAGLPRELPAEDADRTLVIPMRASGVRSLNLSTSVGIVAYEALAQLGFPGLSARVPGARC